MMLMLLISMLQTLLSEFIHRGAIGTNDEAVQEVDGSNSECYSASESSICCRVYSQTSRAPLTWTLSERMIPCWGISTHTSSCCSMSGGIPSFSFLGKQENWESAIRITTKGFSHSVVKPKLLSTSKVWKISCYTRLSRTSQRVQLWSLMTDYVFIVLLFFSPLVHRDSHS